MTKLSSRDLLLAPKLRRLGILMPIRMLMACRETGLPVALGAAILIQESGGGRNIVGHDRGRNGFLIYPAKEGTVEVTKELCLSYLARRGSEGQYGMQGIGTTQLTYWSFQDEAMRLGGLWKPLVQMRVAFGDLAHNIRRSGLRLGVTAYNGSGAAADAYATTVLARMNVFAKALA